MMSAPRLPVTTSLPLAGLHGELHDAGRQTAEIDHVVAAEAVEDEPVVRALGVRYLHRGGEAGHGDHAADCCDGDAVGPDVPSTITCVGRAVAAAAAAGREVDLDAGRVGAGEVADAHGVGAAQRAKRNGLDVVEVHDDVGDVAGEAHPPAVGGDVDDLVDVRAVELELVGPGLALDRVAAVAGIPLERVVAGAEEGDVVALLAVDEVVAVAAEQRVGAVAAEDGVVAGAAVDRDGDEGGEIAGGAEAVVAAVHVDDEALGGADVEAEGRQDRGDRSAPACRWRSR